jgi:hypothetical protein
LPPAPKGLPAPNTTYDFYIAPNDAPAAPNKSGIKAHLEAEFEMATQHAQNDANFRCRVLVPTLRVGTHFFDAPRHIHAPSHDHELDAERQYARVPAQSVGTRQQDKDTEDIRDTWPANPANKVYIPDKTGTG